MQDGYTPRKSSVSPDGRRAASGQRRGYSSARPRTRRQADNIGNSVGISADRRPSSGVRPSSGRRPVTRQSGSRPGYGGRPVATVGGRGYPVSRRRKKKKIPPIVPLGGILILFIIVIAIIVSSCSSGSDKKNKLLAATTADGEPVVSMISLSSTKVANIAKTDLEKSQKRKAEGTDGFVMPDKEDTGDKLIALTFDDGPSGNSVDFVNSLNELGAKCTFFMLGQLIEEYPEGVEAMVAGGHQIANHSYDHAYLPDLDDASANKEIMDTENLLKNIDGKDNHYMRCPYGASSDYVTSSVTFPLIYWSVDSDDWELLDTNAVYQSIVDNAYDGSIILAHEIYETSRQGALMAIKELQSQGYKFVTVEELLKCRAVNIKNGETYYDAQNDGYNLPLDKVQLEFGTFSTDKQPKGDAKAETDKKKKSNT